MSRIGRIAKSTGAGTPPKRPRADILPPKPANTNKAASPAVPATRGAPQRPATSYARPRSETGFIAQYVDQFSPWTVQPKTAKRQSAHEAYGQADMLIEQMFHWRRQRFDGRF